MLSFPSLSFIVFFLQTFWSKFTILFKFFLKKTNHFWTTPSTLFLFPVSLSSCSLRFLVSPNLSVAFFSILELSFFCFWYQTIFFDYLLWFYVYVLQISLFRLQEVAYFQRALHLPGPYLWLLALLLTWKYCHEVSKMISKTSRRSCKFFAVFWKLLAILCHMASLSLFPPLLSNIPLLAIPVIKWMSFSLFPEMIDLS